MGPHFPQVPQQPVERVQMELRPRGKGQEKSRNVFSSLERGTTRTRRESRARPTEPAGDFAP